VCATTTTKPDCLSKRANSQPSLFYEVVFGLLLVSFVLMSIEVL